MTVHFEMSMQLQSLQSKKSLIFFLRCTVSPYFSFDNIIEFIHNVHLIKAMRNNASVTYYDLQLQTENTVFGGISYREQLRDNSQESPLSHTALRLNK